MGDRERLRLSRGECSRLLDQHWHSLLSVILSTFVRKAVHAVVVTYMIHGMVVVPQETPTLTVRIVVILVLPW